MIITGIMAAFMTVIALQSSEYNVNYFDEDYDTSNSHTIRELDELVVVGGTKIQAKSNGVMCLSCALPAVCLVHLMCLIEIVSIICLRYVCLELFFESYWRIGFLLPGI